MFLRYVPVSSRGQDTWFSATGPGFESPYRYHPSLACIRERASDGRTSFANDSREGTHKTKRAHFTDRRRMFTVARSAKMDLPGKPASCDNGSWRFRRHDPPINRQSRLSRTAGCLASPQTMSKRFVYVLRNHVEPATVLRRRHLRGGATPRGAQRWQLYPYCQVPSVVS